MFDRDFIGVRVAGFAVNQMKDRDNREIQLAVLSCEINPFTAEMAGQLHDVVKRTLYTATNAEVNNLLGGCRFNIDIRPQEVVFRESVNQKPLFTLQEVKVDGIHAKRSRKSTAWTLGFTLTCAPASSEQLGLLFESYLKFRVLSFSDAQATLFESEETKKRRVSAAEEAKSVAPVEAAVTH